MSGARTREAGNVSRAREEQTALRVSLALQVIALFDALLVNLPDDRLELRRGHILQAARGGACGGRGRGCGRG